MAMSMHPVVRVAQVAVTGEVHPKRWRMLAGSMKQAQHDSIVDLGCGAAPLLDFIRPGRYAGIDGEEPEVERARHRFQRDGYEFIVADLTAIALSPWRGYDSVTVSSVTHHLSDAEVKGLFSRIVDEIRPGAIFLQDATPMGILGPVVTFLDAGRHMRTESELTALLEADFEMEHLWAYVNPFRSFRQFCLHLRLR